MADDGLTTANRAVAALGSIRRDLEALPSYAPTVGTSGTLHVLRVEMRRAAVHEIDYVLRDTMLDIIDAAIGKERRNG